MNAKLLAFTLIGVVLYFVTHDDVTLFDNFLANGSLWAVVLMCYASSVCHDIIKINKDDVLAASAPTLFSSPLASLFVLLNIPCIIWPPIYIGYYDGWVAGIVAYVLLHIVSFSLSNIFNFKSTTTTFYFWTAMIGSLVAYALSYMDITNQSLVAELQPYQTLLTDLLHIFKALIVDGFTNLKNWVTQLIH